MLTRKLLTVLACLLALTTAAYAQGQGDAQQGNGQKQQPQTEQPKSLPAQPAVSNPPRQPETPKQSPAQPNVDEADSKRSDERAEADLAAQRRMAQAAEDTLHISRIQLYANIVGLFVVLATLGVTAWTGNAARVAAQAAIDALSTERAWMSPKGPDCRLASNALIGGHNYPLAIMIRTVWINGGRSPAVKCVISQKSMIADIGADVPVFDLNEDKGEAIIGPNITSRGAWYIEGALFSDILEGRKAIYLYGKINYGIVSSPGSKHYTEACFKIVVTGVIEGDNGDQVPNFESQIVGTQNMAT